MEAVTLRAAKPIDGLTIVACLRIPVSASEKGAM